MRKTIASLAASFLLMMASTLSLGAQERNVTGLVLDAGGHPLPGVSVIISGTDSKKGTTTDTNGKYAIRAKKDDILLFTCLGYTDVQERVENRTQINVVLKESTQQLDETVVIAYGTAKKSDLTGSVAVVNMGDIENTPAFSLDAALQGRVAGMEVISGGGEPGEDGSILIRGTRSLSAGNDPLIVVDGVVDAVSSFSEINVQDIKNVSVLKDASSTALYGSRGANGVILVTTKGDSQTRLTIAASASVGIAQLPKKLDLMNAAEFAQFRNDLRYMTSFQGNNAMATTPLTSGSGYPVENPASYGQGTDWMDVLSRNAIEQKYYIAAGWGEQRSKVYMSLSYDDIQGIVIGTEMKRIGALLKYNRDIFNWLKFNIRSNYQHTDRDLNKITLSGTSNTAAIALSPMLKITDTWNLYGDTGVVGGSIFNNPYMLAKAQDNSSAKELLNLGGGLEFIIIPELHFKTSFSTTFSDTEGYYYSPSYLPQAERRKTGGTAQRTSALYRNILFENTLTYDKDFRIFHHIDALLGFTMQGKTMETKNTSGTGYLDDEVKYWNMGGLVDKRNLTETTGWTSTKRMSFLGRFNYNYRSRYYLTLNGRYDGSSMFSEGKKWGLFPSAALKWNITNEAFMMGVKGGWLSELSLRVSAGLSGNDALSSLVSQDLLSVSQAGWLFGSIQPSAYYPGRLENANLTWETTDTYNIGLDLSLLNNRITLEAEVYKAYTSNLLLSVANAAQSGFTNRYANIGSTENQGIEVSIKSHNISSRRFDWSTTFSISHNEQIVTDIGNDFEYIATASSGTQMIYCHRKGYPANSLWGYQYAGVWHNKAELEENTYTHQYASGSLDLGWAKYVDVNHDGVLDHNDYVYLGSPEPFLSGGLLNTFKIWGVNLSVYFTYSLGGKIYNLAEKNLGTSLASSNHYRYYLDCWHPVRNPDSNIPSARASDALYSSRMAHDASFFRLQNVSLSYTLDLRQKTKLLRSITFSASGENLLLFSSYNGFDPDISSSKNIRRYDGATYPKPRKFQFSIRFVY